MKTDPYTVAVVMATGAITISAAAITAGLIGGAMWAALKYENRTRTKNAATTRDMR